MLFSISPKSEVLFGEHAADQVGEKTKALGCSKVLVVYDKGVKDAGIAGPVIENLEKAGLKVVHYGSVLADPPDIMVNECGEIARKEKVDGIVGVGGGSTLDTAKAVNVMLGNPGPIQNYYFRPGEPGHKPGKTLVLVPTTAGTASEITSVAVITNTATNTKGGVKGAATVASIAIVDPLLTLGLPPAITAATGMDTFAHALEAYTSANRNIMSDVLAEKSIGLVARYLPRVVRNGSDLEARTNMCFACLIAGMAFSDAAPHFGHAFGHTLGSTHHVPHGTGCAIAQPGVIEIVAEAMPEKVRRIGELMGLEVRDSLSPSGLGTVVSDGIIAFNREVGLPTLKQLNIKESDLPSLAEGMMRDVCFIFLPVKLDQQEVLKVIRKAYAL
jgi:alcohol dehydrogenase class IV